MSRTARKLCVTEPKDITRPLIVSALVMIAGGVTFWLLGHPPVESLTGTRAEVVAWALLGALVATPLLAGAHHAAAAMHQIPGRRWTRSWCAGLTSAGWAAGLVLVGLVFHNSAPLPAFACAVALLVVLAFCGRVLVLRDLYGLGATGALSVSGASILSLLLGGVGVLVVSGAGSLVTTLLGIG